MLKVLYDDQERRTDGQAAELAGLRSSSFVAAAALRSAQRAPGAVPPVEPGAQVTTY